MKKLILLLSLFSTIALSAASITWGTPYSENGNPNQVITTGTFVSAVTAQNYNVTVNGVTFTGTSSNSSSSTITFGSSDVTLTTSFANGIGLGSTGQSGSNPWDANYINLTDRAAVIGAPNGGSPVAMDVNITGLTIGTTYQMEFFEPFWNADWQSTLSDGLGDSVLVNQGTSDGNPPQIVTGTFTADATTETIYINSPTNQDFFGAMELRTEEAPTVPEPATITLLGAGLAGLIARRRKQA